jgi:hypothetical protein
MDLPVESLKNAQGERCYKIAKYARRACRRQPSGWRRNRREATSGRTGSPAAFLRPCYTTGQGWRAGNPRRDGSMRCGPGTRQIRRNGASGPRKNSARPCRPTKSWDLAFGGTRPVERFRIVFS